MEKTFSDEEKLRRAIEISQRRHGYYNSNILATRVDVVNNKKEYKLFKKMILQIIICLNNANTINGIKPNLAKIHKTA